MYIHSICGHSKYYNVLYRDGVCFILRMRRSVYLLPSLKLFLKEDCENGRFYRINRFISFST